MSESLKASQFEQYIELARKHTLWCAEFVSPVGFDLAHLSINGVTYEYSTYMAVMKYIHDRCKRSAKSFRAYAPGGYRKLILLRTHDENFAPEYLSWCEMFDPYPTARHSLTWSLGRATSGDLERLSLDSAIETNTLRIVLEVFEEMTRK